jgi:DHA1 family inner membrane transport protein
MVWLPTFLEDALGLGGAGAAYATALVVIANLVGIFGSGWMMRRTGSGGVWVIPLAALGMALATAAVFLPGLSAGARIAAAVGFSIVGGFIPGRLFNAVPAHAPGPGHLAAGNGMLLQGSALGQFACAPIIAWAVSLAGGAWAAALVPMLSAAGVTALAGALLGLRRT